MEFFRYFLQFEAGKAYASKGDVAIDDFSLSPECFGLSMFHYISSQSESMRNFFLRLSKLNLYWFLSF